MENSIIKNSILVSNKENKQTVDSDTSPIEKSQWLSQLLEENPQILSIRERILPITGGYSFSNIINAASTASLSPVNRFIILQLIYNHLCSTGMLQAAEMIKKETGLNFQIIDQSWQRTHLMILISLGVLPYENPWNIQKDLLTEYVEENFDEDNLSFAYEEDPKLIYQELNDSNSNAIYNDNQHDYQHLIACSLRRLIVLLVLDQLDKFQYQINLRQQSKTKLKTKQKSVIKNFFLTDDDLNGLFLTLHSITKSKHFFDHLVYIFNFTFPDDSPFHDESTQIQLRISILQILHKWVLFRGLFIGTSTIGLIKEFIKTVIESDANFDYDSQADSNSIDIRSFLLDFLNIINHLKSGINPKLPIKKSSYEHPIIKDPQIMFRPNLKFMDADTLEVARQITIISHSSFQKVHSREIMISLLQKKCTTVFCPFFSDFFKFLRHFSQLALESILLSNEKSEAFSKVIEITANLDSLFNYQAVSEILKAIFRPEIFSIVQATQGQIATLRDLLAKCGDAPDSFDDYSKSLLKRYIQMKPAIPNFNAELREANFSPSPDFLNGMINIEKRRIVAEKLTSFYAFQNSEYCFTPVTQIQKTLLAAPSFSKESLEQKIFQMRLKANDSDF